MSATRLPTIPSNGTARHIPRICLVWCLGAYNENIVCIIHYLVNPGVMSPGPSPCLVTRCPTLHVPCSISCDIPGPVRDPTCGHPAAAAVGGGSQGHKVVSTVHCSAVMGTLTPTLCLLLTVVCTNLAITGVINHFSSAQRHQNS